MCLAVAAHLNYNSGSFGKGYFRCAVENLHMALAVGEPGYARKICCIAWDGQVQSCLIYVIYHLDREASLLLLSKEKLSQAQHQPQNVIYFTAIVLTLQILETHDEACKCQLPKMTL